MLGDDTTLAYIFVASWDAPTWEPLSDGNATVVQPGAAPQLPTITTETGPALFESVREQGRYRQVGKMRRYERFIAFEDGADPPAWTWPEQDPDTRYDDDRDWRKLGETPLYLQGEERPLGTDGGSRSSSTPTGRDTRWATAPCVRPRRRTRRDALAVPMTRR